MLPVLHHDSFSPFSLPLPRTESAVALPSPRSLLTITRVCNCFTRIVNMPSQSYMSGRDNVSVVLRAADHAHPP